MQNATESQTIRRDKQGRMVIHIPMTFKKRGGRKEMILPPGCRLDDHQDGPSINKPLAIAVALGHRWLDLLTEGKFQSVQELAEAVDIDPSLLRRHLSLTCLPPKVVLEILDGREPDGLSLAKLSERHWEGDRPPMPWS